MKREIEVTQMAGGKAYITLGQGEVRDSVDLSEHEEADRIPTLDSLCCTSTSTVA